jgi:hypothetical protein
LKKAHRLTTQADGSFHISMPATGLNVQGLSADKVPAENAETTETYESVTCPVCTRVHLVNPSTGRTLGEDDA